MIFLLFYNIRRKIYQSIEYDYHILNDAASITIIADRESDIYEEFVRIPDGKTYLLIRSLQNRILSTQTKISQHLIAIKLIICYSRKNKNARRNL